MGDIFCRVCGEPWDAYGVYNGDMDEGEKHLFLKGKGCPCCKGKKRCYKGVLQDKACEDDACIGCEHRTVKGEDIICTWKIHNEEREMRFLTSLTEETDDDPVELLDDYVESKLGLTPSFEKQVRNSFKRKEAGV